MTHQLSAGICKLLQSASLDDASVFSAQHIVQFRKMKKVTFTSQTGQPQDRYRIIMSDGLNFMQAMLATQLNHLVLENQIINDSIVVLKHCTYNTVQNQRLVIVMDIGVVAKVAEKIGDPRSIGPSDSESPSLDQGASATNTPIVPQHHEDAGSSTSHLPVQQKATRHETFYRIESLSPYQNNWTIKARVTQKSDIKTWSNTRGEGKLFNVTLMDDTGEIRATGFNLAVDELYSKLEEGKVYFISKARVNLAKKKFSNVNNDYELHFERQTQVEECLEVTNVPTIKYNFVNLISLQELAKDAICDVIGVVKEVSDITEITSTKLSRQIHKRELTLVDKSGFSVRMTLWGKQAEQYNTSEATPVIAFKGVKVGDYGGRSLSMFSSSTMQINPDIEECFALRGWYDSAGTDQTFKTHSSSSGGFSAPVFNRSDIRSLFDVKQALYGMPGKPDTFCSRATITNIKSENISYPACPTIGCNKKVVKSTDGSWRCEKCDKTFPAPEHRYIISMGVADYSDLAWLQGFNEVGLIVFGRTADELLAMKEENPSQFNDIIQEASGNTFNFTCRAKQDTYNETTRIRYGISRIQELNYKEEAMALRDLLYSS